MDVEERKREVREGLHFGDVLIDGRDGEVVMFIGWLDDGGVGADLSLNYPGWGTTVEDEMNDWNISPSMFWPEGMDRA